MSKKDGFKKILIIIITYVIGLFIIAGVYYLIERKGCDM